MSVISLFSGSYCKKDQVLALVEEQTGYVRVTDETVVAEAAELSGLPVSKLARAMSSKLSVFNKFTHEKERAQAWLRLAMARKLERDSLLFDGFTGLLIPAAVGHALKVCLIADLRFRLDTAMSQKKIGEKEALRLIREGDQDCAAWVESVHCNKDPWTAGLYDILIPMNKLSVEDAARLILENLDKPVVRTTPESKEAVLDALLAAQVEVALAQEGHNVSVSARGKVVTITINKNVMLLSRLEEELKELAGKVDGVARVEVKVGRDFYQTDVYRKVDFDLPSKVLLVDDERDFVQTLSERLEMRDVGAHVVYDGASALEMVSEDEPDVMILDLKMPGIDGIEVLKRVKSEKPKVEVIILTGHGNERDRDLCLSLGAFAYLQKPVNIDVLSETLRRANEKAHGRS